MRKNEKKGENIMYGNSFTYKASVFYINNVLNCIYKFIFKINS